jgi:carbonic anhydrase
MPHHHHHHKHHDKHHHKHKYDDDWSHLETEGPKHDADVLLLSCIDFRFVEQTHDFMNPYLNDYDHFILAGASLGVNQHEFKDWPPTFWKHVDLAIKLHKINKVIVVDHDDCGFYKHIYPGIYPGNETKLHTKNLRKLKKELKHRYPKLSYEGYIAELGGPVVRVV